MQPTARRTQNAWAMYDWANSAYNLVITSTIFPAYYEAMTGDKDDATIDHVRFLGMDFVNTALYNYVLAVAFAIVAVISPFLSGVADTRGNKKSFLRLFSTVGSLACCGLYFYDADTLGLGLSLTVIACVGFWGSLVFYNSYLPQIAGVEERDGLSAKGFMYGYVGSVLLQIICFVFVLNDTWFEDKTFPARLSFLLTGLWWLGFSQIPLLRLPKGVPNKIIGAASNGYAELRKVWAQVRQLPVLKRFLISYFLYNMGVQTVMLAATLYGKSELGIPTENLIVAILIIQVIAIPGAWLIAKLSGAISNLRALMACVAVWIGICVAGYLLPAHNPMAFYILATVVGFVMGGIQSLSRSTYSKLMPERAAQSDFSFDGKAARPDDSTSFFSFYDVTEKIAIVIGMLSFGLIQEATGSQRNSVLALGVFFILGMIMLVVTKRASRVSLVGSR